MQWPLVGREAALSQVLELVEAGTGVAILGPAGVGKSRLLHEMADRAENSGKAVVRTVASESTRSIPFAPFVDLLPGQPTQDRLAMLGAARQTLEAMSGARGLLLTIDDAHQLDETSLAFLVSAVASGVATIALTAVTGEQMEVDLVDLWTNGVISRIDLGSLDREECRSVLEARLGPVTETLETALWQLSHGNPLILHELVEGAVDVSIKRRDDQVWDLEGSLAESPRLSDLVASRLRAVPNALRPAMDVVAVGSPLPWDLAREVLGDDLIELEDRGLVDIADGPGGRTLLPAHPLYGEVLKTHLGDSRSRAAYLRLVEGAMRLDHTPDPLRAALWQRDSGELLSPELAAAGAGAALVRHQPGLATELLRPLGTDDDRVAVLLGRALSYQQQFAEAEEVLAGIGPTDEPTLAEVASIRAQNMGFGLGRVEDAKALLEAAESHIEDPDLRARLTNERAMVSAIHGKFADSMFASDTVLSDSATSPVSKAAAYVTLTVALAMTGDCDRMDELIDDALRVSGQARDVLPFAKDQVGVMQMSSALHAGRIAEAVNLCHEALDHRDRGNAMTTTWLTASVMAHELSGQLVDAKSAAEAALRIFAEADPFGLEPQARGVVGLASGQMGESVPEEGLGLDHPQAGPRLTVWLNRGRAWSVAAGGELEAAARIAAEGGRAAVSGEHFAWATFCYSDAVRFGYPDLVVDQIRQIDTSRGALLLDAMKAHAESSAARDPGQLREVSNRFASFGSWLLAAEGYASASALYQSADQVADAAKCAALSMAAELRCQEPRTPALAARPALITPREMEVALDAADGMTSPQISVKRYISVRTVDNHLSSVYRKLALSGREELGSLFSFEWPFPTRRVWSLNE